MVDDDEVLVERWTYVPEVGRPRTISAVGAFAAAHGMGREGQGRLELALTEVLSDAVMGDRDEPVGSALIDLAIDRESVAVRIEHDGYGPSPRVLARIEQLVDRTEARARSRCAPSVILFETAVVPDTRSVR